MYSWHGFRAENKIMGKNVYVVWRKEQQYWNGNEKGNDLQNLRFPVVCNLQL